MLYIPYITRSILIFSETKWRSWIKHVNLFNFQRRSSQKDENCRFVEVPTSEFGLFIIYPNFLSCFQLVPEGGQRN